MGGAPYCDFVFGPNNCPRWPSWAASDTTGKLAIESRENSAKYLGWALHIIQDLTVPYHANNDASPDHPKYEGNVDQQVLNNEYEHLPSISGFYEEFNPKQLADEAFNVGIRGAIGYGTIGSRLDTAIKLGAALMERFFDRVTPQEQRYSNIIHKLSSKYVVTGATTDGGEIHLWGPIPKGHEDRYSFLLIPTHSGNYYLVHKYSGKYVYAGSKNGEQLVLQKSYIPGGQEGHYEFKLIPKGDGYYYLMNTQSGKYVVSGATNDGGKIHLWGPIPGGHEDRYKFRLVPPPSQPSRAVLHLLGLKCDEPATSGGDEIQIRISAANEWETSFKIDQGGAFDLSSTKLEFQKREFVEFIEEGDPAAILEITDAVADDGPQSVAINIKGDGRYTLYYEVQSNALTDKKTVLRLISLKCEEPATAGGDDIDIFIDGHHSNGQIPIDEDDKVNLETLIKAYKFQKRAIIEFNEDSDPAGRVVIDDTRANLGLQSTSVRVKDDGVYTLQYEVICGNC